MEIHHPARMRFDIHVHTNFSDGHDSPEEMVERAKRMGLSGIAITDHDEIDGALEALKYSPEDFTVIPGIEVSSREGHILCLGIKEKIDYGIPAAEVIKRTHELGGLAIAAHPYDRIRSGVGDLIYKLDFDAVELHNARTLVTSVNEQDVLNRVKLPVVGGSDAHSVDELGCITIIVHDDPLSAIKNGNFDVIVNYRKSTLIKSYLKRKLGWIF